MRSAARISGRLIAAARALVGVSSDDFAAARDLPVEMLTRLEVGGSAWVHTEIEVAAVKRALDHFGVVIVEESESMGVGVRLFTGSFGDVRHHHLEKIIKRAAHVRRLDHLWKRLDS